MEIQEKNCVGSGAFCFTPPSQENLEKYPLITTQQLIRENIRQRCVYDVMVERPEEDDDHHVFNYLFWTHMVCLEYNKELTDECAQEIFEQLFTPDTIDEIDECVLMSYEEPGDTTSENDLLREDRESAI